MTTNFGSTCSALLGSCLLVACVQASPPAGEREASKKASNEATSTPPVEPTPAAKPPEPLLNRAYVSVDGVGLHVLDDGGFRLLLEMRSSIRDMQLVDGQLFVLSPFGVQRIDADGRSEDVAELDGPIYAKIGDPLALANIDGQAWVAGALGVARHSGTWQLTPVEASSVPSNTDLAIDRAGRPWLVLGSLHRYRDDAWQKVALEAGSEPLALAADPRSEAMFIHAGCKAQKGMCLLLRANGDETPTQISVPVGECSDYSHIAVSSDGASVALAGRCGLVRQNLEGEAQPFALGLDAGWPGQPLRSFVLDAGGRMWAATHDSLLIVASAGVQEYPLAQLTDIAGPVSAMVVVGEGPPAPTLGSVSTGGISGTLVVGSDKRPVPGAKLEVCNRLPPGAQTEPDPTRSLCAGVEGVQATTTDSEGRFEFSNLAIGHYYFGVELDGRWVRARPKALTMRAGMTGNVGKVPVDN
jgi:hypothetical protein